MSIEIVSQLTQDDLDPRNRPYRPRNGLLELFQYTGPEILLSGPSGTSKTTACLNKCFMLCEQYPGIRVLFLRKTREALTESVLAPFEEKVVPEGHPCLAGPNRHSRKNYTFPNGSVIVVGGLRQGNRNETQKVMGPNYDIVYIDEAIDLTEEEWEKACTRKRNFKMPYQQLMATTNPSFPTHWLKQRCEREVCKYVETHHEDNDLFWDDDKKEWNPPWYSYLKNLENMTGVQRERFFLGKWVQAEGSVYDEFEHRRHVVDPSHIPKEWKKIRAIDFGYNDPFVCLWIAHDPERDRLYVYREYVRTKGLVEDHARTILEMEDDGEDINATVCDHDAEGRATLERHLGCSATPADKRKDKKHGIGQVQSRLRNKPDGQPGILFFRTLYGQYDPHMAEKKLPIGILSEVDGYVWDPRKDKPMDGNDHSCDSLLYGVLYFTNNSVKWVAPDPIKKPETIPTFQRPRGPIANMPQFRTNNGHPFFR